MKRPPRHYSRKARPSGSSFASLSRTLPFVTDFVSFLLLAQESEQAPSLLARASVPWPGGHVPSDLLSCFQCFYAPGEGCGQALVGVLKMVSRIPDQCAVLASKQDLQQFILFPDTVTHA